MSENKPAAKATATPLNAANSRTPLVAVKGMNDILPPDSARWEWFEDTVRALMRRYGYLNVRTPIVEPTALFVRGLGEVTDIVEKEMYSFEDRLNGEHLTLRPENTAGLVRAVVEHNLLYNGGKRLFYMGPMFRHERPQRGRYRQFYQVGAEAMGFAGPELDAELISLPERDAERVRLGEPVRQRDVHDVRKRDAVAQCQRLGVRLGERVLLVRRSGAEFASLPVEVAGLAAAVERGAGHDADQHGGDAAARPRPGRGGAGGADHA